MAKVWFFFSICLHNRSVDILYTKYNEKFFSYIVKSYPAAIGEVCPTGFETVEGSIAIPRGGMTPSSVKKVVVQRCQFFCTSPKKYLVDRP